MTQAFNVTYALILGLFAAIMTGIALIEGFLGGLMTQAGIPGQFQKPALIVAAVLLIVVALRVFGRVFGFLIVIFLILLLLHILFPGLSAPGGSIPA